MSWPSSGLRPPLGLNRLTFYLNRITITLLSKDAQTFYRIGQIRQTDVL